MDRLYKATDNALFYTESTCEEYKELLRAVHQAERALSIAQLKARRFFEEHGAGVLQRGAQGD